MQTDPYSPVPNFSQTSTSPQRSGPNRGLIIGLIAGVVLLALIALSAIHYTGPTRTLQSFVNDFFISGNASDAYHQVCSDAQANVTESQIQTGINALKTSGVTYDISGITYSLADESFFGDAHVRLGGTISVTVNGQKQSAPISGIGTIITLHSAGLGWCIESNPISSS